MGDRARPTEQLHGRAVLARLVPRGAAPPAGGSASRLAQAGRDAWLAATLGLSLVLGVLAVARTLGHVFAYRLRWTWVLAMIAAVVVAWTAWTWAARARRGGERWLVPLSIGALPFSRWSTA